MNTHRILYVNHEPACGGAERSLLTLLEALDRQRWTPLLATSAAGPLAEAARALDVEVALVPMRAPGRLRQALRIAAAGAELAEVIRARGVALVHTNSLLGGYCGLWAARRAGVPCLWHVRDIGYPALGALACRQADHVVAISEATARALPWVRRRNAGGLASDGERCSVVYNGVAPRFFAVTRATAGGLRAELQLAPETLLVGMLGRLDPWKGHVDLLRAAALVREQHRGVHFGDPVFVIAGAPLPGSPHHEWPRRLADLAADLGIGDVVHFLGHREDTTSLLADLDVVVHPSREPEPFGRTIAEAQAAGRAVVATRTGGIPELIEPGATGLLVPPGDHTALAAAITSLLADPGTRARLGEAARRSAAARFTAAAHAASIGAIYERLLRGPAEARRSRRASGELQPLGASRG